MILLYILFGIGLLITAGYTYHDIKDYDLGEGLITLIKGIGITAGVSFGILFVFSMFVGNANRIDTVDECYTVRKDLMALNDTKGIAGEISGDFFVGCGTVSGSIGQQFYYVFYYKNSDGEIIFNQFTPNEVHLYEDSETPYVITKYRHVVNEIKKGLEPWVIGMPKNETTTAIRRELHVPKGTVLRETKLDLK